MSKYNGANMSNDTPDVVNMHHASNISHSMPHLHPHNVVQHQDKCSPHPVRNTPTMQPPPMASTVLMKSRHNLQNLDLSPSSRNMVLNTSKYIKLNVGGSLFYSTIGTLTKEDNMLRAMFSGRMEVLTDNEGWILIDRCGKHFGTILNFLRNGSIILPENKYEIAELLAESKYYLIQGLINQCEVALMWKSTEADPICRVPVLTSLREEQELVKKTNKPIVKFMYNRSNNKYSYTPSSDDNLLKNIELFDKLSLQFNGRIMFMKDTIGDEICVWSFYGQHRKVAEICCTSIVYATEKKQTKVEFPEARIYEESLNILLFEPDKYDANGLRLHFEHDDRTKNKDRVDVHRCQSDEDNDDEGRGHRVRRIHVANSNRPT